MKILLLTGYDEKFAPLGSLTTPLMKEYAERHGLDFKCQREYPDRYPAYWQKLVDVVQAFDDGYGLVVWLDADQAITNSRFSSVFWKCDERFNVSEDWGRDVSHLSHFSMCGFTATPKVRHLFQWCLDHEEEYAHGEFPDQKPMRFIYPENENDFAIYGPRVFNSVPIEVHETVRQPWQPGDWCAHLTMLPIDRRVELFHEIRRQATR